MKSKSNRIPRVQAAALSLLISLFFGTAAFAQEAETRESDTPNAKILEAAKSLQGAGTGAIAYEGEVDRDQYLVGPGDRLALQIWSPAYQEVPVYVTGDGRVAVPFAGPVHVAGHTLTEAEQMVSAELDRAVKRARVSVSLLEPRLFRVHVTGSVFFPGTYAVRATTRLTEALTHAGGVRTKLEIQSGDTVNVPAANLRRVELRGRDGETRLVDMLRFTRGGSLAGNPYLTDGDVIYIPGLSDEPQVGVFGAVRNSGFFDYAPQDNVESVLEVAGGLTSLADSADVSILRADGKTEHVTLSGQGLSIELRPGDRVHVSGSPLQNLVGTATVSGQVARPGAYPIEPGKTSAQTLLELAGGSLPAAELRTARLVRQEEDPIMSERQRVLMKPQKSMSKDDPTMLADLELSAEFARWTYGTVVLDLTAQEGEAGFAGDVMLQDGDHLEIPEQPLGVRVLGYVNNAGEVPWIEKGKLRDYVSAAGGKNRAGWMGRAVVIKARNGSQIRYSNQVAIDPGDVIFLPQRPRTTGWERFKDVITVVAQVATVVLVVTSATK